eukprot:1857434-Alexandrium_andersonii.AAC.1
MCIRDRGSAGRLAQSSTGGTARGAARPARAAPASRGLRVLCRFGGPLSDSGRGVVRGRRC